MRTLVERAAAAGRVTIPAERAVSTLRAVGTGVVFTLIAMPGAALSSPLAADLLRTTALTDDEKALLEDATTDRVAQATERP